MRRVRAFALAVISVLAKFRFVSRLLDSEEISRQLDALPRWAQQGNALVSSHEFPDFPTAITGVNRIAADAEAMNHHPDIDIRWRTVSFTLSTHSQGGITQLDIELAHVIAGICDELGSP